jgi:diguanylate cyclase (GGDEF)-like protein/PAS domain S-box-containing protein
MFWLISGPIVLLCLLALVTAGSALGDITYVTVAGVLTGAFALTVHARKLQPASAWMTFAAGLLLMAVGDAVYSLPAGTDLGDSGVTIADLVYLVGSATMVLGALRLKGSQAGERDRESMIDACSIGLAIAVMAWRPLIEPRLDLTDASPLGRMVSGSYPLFDLIVLAMMCWILLGVRKKNVTTALLVVGAATYLAADLAYTIRIDRGTIDDPSLAWLDTLWLVAYGLYLLAVVHPGAGDVVKAPSVDHRTISRSRLALSGVTLIAPIVALGMSGVDARHVVVALAVECTLVVLVLIRLADLAAGERRAQKELSDQELLFRSLVQNASEAVVVLDADLVVGYASPAVRSLLGVAPDALLGHSLVEAVAGLDSEESARLVASAVSAPAMVVTGEVPLVDVMGTTWLELRLTNMVHEPAVGGIVVNLHDVSARRLVQEELEWRASTDALTGLPNRATFLDRLGQALDGTREDVAVIYCDLDGFKSVNDRFGHEEGDRVLELAAGRLAGAVRGDDLVARLGGDEFAVLIQGPSAGSRAATVAARIVSALQSPLVADGTVLAVSASLGVSCTNGRAEVPATLLRSADQAMYQAKRAGGNRFVVAEHDEDRSASLPRPASVSPSSAPVVSGR